MGGRKGTPIFGRAKAREGLDYTERQLSILCDDVPLSAVSLNELSNIMKKANARCDNYNYEIAKLTYEAKANPNNYKPSMTVGEAKAILQSLTPWEIIWT